MGLIILGVFAYSLGLDHNPEWGRSRILMVLVGCGLSITMILAISWTKVIGVARRVAGSPSFRWLIQCQQVLLQTIQHSPTYRFLIGLEHGFRRIPPVSWIEADPSREAAAYGITSAVLVILIYTWFITAGTLTHWFPYYSHYYDLLAQAFQHGQLHLLQSPPTELTSLKNPYDYREREAQTGLSYLWDASLYQGNYYLYWGPVPAAILTAIKPLLAVPVEDQYLLYMFSCGLVVIVLLLLLAMRKAFFPNAPGWSIAPFLLGFGLAVPVLWLVNRPAIYETAIAGGQFFLIGGLAAAFQGLLKGKSTPIWLFLAGLCWTFSIGTRFNLVIAVVIFVVLVIWRLFQQMGRKINHSFISAVLALGIPLLLGGAILGSYNFARFGNILETGHRYQLTGPALPENYAWVTSPRYILPNLYSYLLRPLTFESGFPFVFAPFVKESMWPFFIHLPEHYYYSEPVAGLFPAIPVLLTAILPPIFLICNALKNRKESAVENRFQAWWVLLLTSGSLMLLGTLLLFISPSMRYLADVVPILTLLAALGFWQARVRLKNCPLLCGSITVLLLAAVLVTVIFGVLVGFSTGDKRLETNNPALYYQIASWLSRQ